MMKHANAISASLDRQYSTIARCNTQAFRAKRDAELLMRMLYNVPLHEWAQAKARGNAAVHLLLVAYNPGHAHRLIADGHVPCCPPWASRRYREASIRPNSDNAGAPGSSSAEHD